MLARLLTHVLPLIALVATLLAWWSGPRPPASGVVGRYYGNDQWSGPPIVERVESEISTDTLASHPELRTLPAFTAEWSGFLVVREPHVFRFATKSDDGSWLWIDEQLVVDNGGVHGSVNVTREWFLSRGVHAFRVRYLEAGGGASLLLGQSRPGGGVQHPGPLVPEAVTYEAVRLRELWPLALVALWYVTLSGLAAVLTARLIRAARGRLPIAAFRDRWFLGIAAVGLALVVVHIDYGAGPYVSFSTDELMPLDTLEASGQLFRFWNLRWAPGQPALLTLLLQPFVWARALFDLPLADPAVASLMLLVMRAFSVLLLLLTLALVYDVASDLGDRTSAVLAVALLSLTPVIVYFGSFANLEMPHLFWMTASWWAWLQFLKHRDLPSSIAFGAFVGISLAIKDQAYGYYLAAPVAVWYVLRNVRDRRVLAIGLATLAAFALGHGLPWAWERFPDHVMTMTTASRPFQMYPRSPAGQLQLALATMKAFIWAAGIPLAVAFVGGVVEEIRSGRGRRLAALMIPVFTYYFGFLIVIAYVYDRFLIAVLPVAAVVGGLFLRSLLNIRTLPAVVRYGIPAVLLGVGLLNATAQNSAFRADARHQAAAWMAGSLPCGASVGVTFDTRYVPPLDCYDVWRFLPSHTEQAVRWPEYFVLNETYAQRFLTTDAGGTFIKRLVTGELGYRLVFRADARPPSWAPLYWERRFRNGREDPDTTLDKPINAIEVWQLTTGTP